MTTNEHSEHLVIDVSLLLGGYLMPGLAGLPAQHPMDWFSFTRAVKRSNRDISHDSDLTTKHFVHAQRIDKRFEGDKAPEAPVCGYPGQVF